jgi:hypothetical protein
MHQHLLLHRALWPQRHLLRQLLKQLLQLLKLLNQLKLVSLLGLKACLVAASQLQSRQFALLQILRNAMVVVRDNVASSAIRVVSAQNEQKVKANAVMVVDVTHVVVVVASVAQSAVANVVVNVVQNAPPSAVTRLVLMRARIRVLRVVQKVATKPDQKAETKVVARVQTVAISVTMRATKHALTLKAIKLLQII